MAGPMRQPNFLTVFKAYRPTPDLAAAMEGWKVAKAVIDKATRAIRAELTCPVRPPEALVERVQEELAAAYRADAVLSVTVEAEELPDNDRKADSLYSGGDAPPPPTDEDAPPPPSDEDAPPPPGDEDAPPPPTDGGAPPPPEEPVREDPFKRTEAIRAEALKRAAAVRKAPAKSGKKDGAGKVIFGKEIKKDPMPMSELDLDMGTVVVEGDVFAIDHRELKKRGAWVVSFDVTDQTSSIRVTKFFPGDEGKAIVDGVKKGMRLLIQGHLTINRFDNDMVLEPYSIMQGKKPEGRKDTAPEKRVELHLHTRMSAMDALTDAGAAVKRAAGWGHPAIAITDHGVAQSFPDAWHAADKAFLPKKNEDDPGETIKLIYGVEAYMVPDRPAVNGNCDMPFDGSFVAFDLETTGLSRYTDRITEIGAVLVENGEITAEFNTFADPQRKLDPENIRLTGITDEMLVGAPSQEEAIRAFLDFAGDRPLVAHNAAFDMGFMREGCARSGIKFDYPSIDTLILAQKLLPNLSKHKLDVVAKYLRLPEFNHHRASDDAATAARILPPLLKMLEEKGVHYVSEINAALRGTASGGSAWSHPYHLIILVKDKTGLKNLYRLISDSHLKYFKRKPIMPKSLVEEHREGLILGSACEAGELFQALIEGQSAAELKTIAGWYDYLEIQPLSNNAFMLRPDRKGRVIAKDEEQLREWNRAIVKLGEELDKPVCATGDVHFMDPEDEIYRHILLDSMKFDDADAPNPLYFRTTDEMLEEFSYLGEEKAKEVVVKNTNLVASWVERFELLPKDLFPPKLENSDGELKDLVWGKAHALYGENPPKVVVDRIETELGDILGRHYDVIYMSAQKLVQDSLEHGYLVGSRGSVGSSIVAFMSGITEVNSLPPHYRCPNCKHSDFEFGVANGYGCGADMPDAVCPVCGTKYEKDGFNIPFETFLGFGGDKVPDIDLNFSGEYQANAHRKTFELFGKHHVFRAGTIGTVAEKTAFGYVKKYLDARGLHVTRAEENRLAKGCTGVKRTTGQHPGGMVVVPQDMSIYDFCPVQHPADDTGTDIITTHFEYHSMEANLLKLDMLGHDDPSMIRMLQDLTGVDPQKIPLDDPDTMSIFTSSKVLGFENDKVLGPTGSVAIPEFGTGFTRGMLQETQPTQFDILIRLSGFSHGTDVWLGNARDLILSGTASVGQAIGCRDDIMIYLMSMGMNDRRAFKFMEAVRKGAIHKGKPWPDGIVEEMQSLGVPDWYIESCRKIQYLFPKAHAVAYVMMAFRIAWFKVHRPLAFYAAYFSIRAKAFDATVMCRDFDTVKRKMREIKAKMDEKSASAVEEDMYTTLEVVYEFYLRGFTFHPINFFTSDAVNFLVDWENNALTPPFTSLPGLGDTAAWSVVEQRKGKSFVSVEEASAACPKLTNTHVELLKEMGAFGDLPDESQLTLF